MFVHVLDPADSAVVLEALGARVLAAAMLPAGRRVLVSEGPEGVTLRFPASASDQPDRVIGVVVSRP